MFASMLSRLGYQMARSPVLPLFAQELGAPPELIGLIVAASTITGVFMKLPSGALSDLFGRKRLMVAGGIFFAVPPLLYPLVSDPVVLMLLRFIHGFATAIFSPVAAAYVASLATERRGAYLGWFSAGNDLGSTAGPLLGGALLFYTMSYDIVFFVVGAIGLWTLLMIWRLPEAPDVPVSHAIGTVPRWRQLGEGLREVMAHPAVIFVSLAEAVMYVGFGAFLGFLPLYAKEAALNEMQIALILAVQMATAIVAKPLAGRASDRIGRKAVIVLGLLLCAVSLSLIFNSTSFALVLLLSALLGLGIAAITPATNAMIADLVRAQRLGTAMGLFGTIWDMGEAAGPIIIGLLLGGLGFSLSFQVIAAAMAAFAIFFAVLVTEPRSRGQSHSP